MRRLLPVLLTATFVLGGCWFGGDDDTSEPGDDASDEVGDDAEGGDDGDDDSSEPVTTSARDCDGPGFVPDQLDEVHSLISSTVLADFFSQRHDDGYTSNRCWHDWTTDDCSAPGLGSTGLSYDFTHPCHRHDFGYRNYKRLEAVTGAAIWNAENKFATDDQFLEDIREHCSSRPWYLKTQCLGWAQAYYYAVRAFG